MDLDLIIIPTRGKLPSPFDKSDKSDHSFSEIDTAQVFDQMRHDECLIAYAQIKKGMSEIIIFNISSARRKPA